MTVRPVLTSLLVATSAAATASGTAAPRPDARCHACGYDLRSLPTTGRCPECAEPIRASRANARSLRGGRWHGPAQGRPWLVPTAGAIANAAALAGAGALGLAPVVLALAVLFAAGWFVYAALGLVRESLDPASWPRVAALAAIGVVAVAVNFALAMVAL